MATFSNSDPYLAIERALRAARSRAPSNEGPRSRQMWDQYQADREPYGNRPWRPTPGPVITERDVEAVANELGVSPEDAAELIRQTAQAATSDSAGNGWMAQGLMQYGMLNAAIQQAPTLKGIAETFTKIGKPETWGREAPQKAALPPAVVPNPQTVAPIGPTAIPSPPQTVEEMAAELGQAQMAQAGYNPRGINSEEAVEAPVEAPVETEAETEAAPGAQYEESDRLGMFANPNIGRGANESNDRFNQMFNQPQSLLAMLGPPAQAPAVAAAPVPAPSSRDVGAGRTGSFTSRGLAQAAINPEEIGIPGPDIAGGRAAGLAAGVGLPGLAYAPVAPTVAGVETPGLSYAPQAVGVPSVETPAIAYAPAMPAMPAGVETPAISYNPQAYTAEVAGPSLGYAPAAPAFPATVSRSPESIEVDEIDVPGANMAASRAANAAQAALAASEFGVPGANFAAARQAAEAQAARQAAAELEGALTPAAPATVVAGLGGSRGVAGPANEMAAAQDYGFDPATIRGITSGQRVTEVAKGLTANTTARTNPVTGVVMHETFGVSGIPSGVIAAANSRGAGYHYVVDIEGNVYQMVPEDRAIAHIGDREVAAYSNSPMRNVNTIGIGIQTHPGTRPNVAQTNAASGLARYIAARRGIDINTNVVGHGDLAARGQGPSAEGRSAVNALRGMPNTDARAETGPNKPRSVDPLTRAPIGPRAGIENIINTILGIQAANAAPVEQAAYAAEGFDEAEESAPAPAPAVAGLGFAPTGFAATTPSAAISEQGGGTGGSSSSPGATGASGGSTPGAAGLGTGGTSVAGESAVTGQGVGGFGTGTGVASQTGAQGAGTVTGVEAEGPGVGNTSALGTAGPGTPTEVGLQGPKAFAETVAAMLEQGMITEEEAAALNQMNAVAPAFNAPMQFTQAPISFNPFAPAVETPLSNVNPPGMPAYGSFRGAQEQGMEAEEAEEEGFGNFGNAFGNPSAYGPMATALTGVAGISLGAAPQGVDNVTGQQTGTAFGGLGIGQGAVETSQAQMAQLGLEGLFGQAFANPLGYAAYGLGPTTQTETEAEAQAEAETTSAEPGSMPGVDTSSTSQTDGPGATDSPSSSGDGNGGGSGDGTGGSPGGDASSAGDSTGSGPGGGPSGGGEGGGQGGMGASSGDVGGTDGNAGGTGAGADGGEWADGGYIDPFDRAILRAILAAERMHSRDRKASSGYVMPFARFANGGEIVENSVEYTPNGVIYSQVVQRALNAAKRRNAA